MQDFGSPQPQGSFGAAPPQKKGLSKGCLIGLIIGVVAAVGGGIFLIAAGVGGYYLFGRGDSVSNVGSYNTTTNTSYGTATSGGAAVEGPNPTAAQRSAVAGGQSATWEQQQVTWTVPQRWSRQSVDSTTFHWRSPGTWEAASLIASIAPMSADFPAEASINAFYQQAQTRKTNGEVNEVRWLNLDGVKGVMFRESSPEDEDSPQRLQWMGYRNYKGQTQLVNLIFASRGKDFARHEDALYGILYTTDFTN